MPKNPPKAYKDINFLESDHARDVRIIAEYEQTRYWKWPDCFIVGKV